MRRAWTAALAAALLPLLAVSRPATASLTPEPAASDVPTLVLVSGERGNGTASLSTAVERAGLHVVAEFERVDVVAAVGDATDVTVLRRQPEVVRVEDNVPVEPLDDAAHRATGVAALRDTELNGQLRHLRRTPAQPFDGSGVSIAVVDENFHPNHEQFTDTRGSKFDVHLEQVCRAPGEWAHYATGTDPLPRCDVWRPANPPTDTRYPHGTAVAATAAGYARTTPSGLGTSGVAPGARLVGLSTGVQGAMFNVVSALNWVLEHHRDPCGDGSCPPIRVVNNSYGIAADDGATSRVHDPDSPVSRVTEALVDEGVVVVFAAGNSGGDGTTNQMSWIGMHPKPGVLTVGAFDDASAGERDAGIARFSSRGLRGDVSTYPDVLAPGVWYTIACPALTVPCVGPGVDGEYKALDGTSISAPYVAGLVALMLEANPGLRPADVERILEATAYGDTLRTHAEPDPSNPTTPTSFDAGHGLVDAVGAVAAALGRRPLAAPDGCPGTPSEATINDPAGDVTVLWTSTGASPADPAHDIRSVRAEITADALAVTMQLGDVPLVEDRLRATIEFFVDGVLGIVDVERALTGDTVTVSFGPFVATGAVDPEADSIGVTVGKADGSAMGRTVVRTTYTAVGIGIADADWTHGACAVWPG